LAAAIVANCAREAGEWSANISSVSLNVGCFDDLVPGVGLYSMIKPFLLIYLYDDVDGTTILKHIINGSYANGMIFVMEGEIAN